MRRTPFLIRCFRLLTDSSHKTNLHSDTSAMAPPVAATLRQVSRAWRSAWINLPVVVDGHLTSKPQPLPFS